MEPPPQKKLFIFQETSYISGSNFPSSKNKGTTLKKWLKIQSPFKA